MLMLWDSHRNGDIAAGKTGLVNPNQQNKHGYFTVKLPGW